MLLKPKNWKGKALKGEWLVEYKIDGVRAIITDGVALSRNGKPLHNLQNVSDGDYEIFLGNWEDTVSAVRTHNAEPIPQSRAFNLHGGMRLYCRTVLDPTAEEISALMEDVCADGYEGLVLKQGDMWIKVKPKDNTDIVVTGYNEGKGRNVGRMGSLITEKGNVPVRGDAIMAELWAIRDEIVGMTIEVSFWEYTPAGKFRFPNFERLRFDKDADA